MFYRPSHRPGMFLKQHLTDRRPLNPYQWIDQAPPEAWLAAEMIEEVPQVAPPEKADREQKTRRSAKPLGSGEPSNTSGPLVMRRAKAVPKLYGLFKSLTEIGCSKHEASTIMYQETPLMHDPGERAAKSSA